ncbi:hypothetical protein Q8G50_31835, partial [Klebsiella pneumoniae]
LFKQLKAHDYFIIKVRGNLQSGGHFYKINPNQIIKSCISKKGFILTAHSTYGYTYLLTRWMDR